MSLITMKTLKSSMCHWPIGDPRDGDFHFCGDPSEQGRPYCVQHNDKAHSGDTRRNAFVRPKHLKKAKKKAA